MKLEKGHHMLKAWLEEFAMFYEGKSGEEQVLNSIIKATKTSNLTNLFGNDERSRAFYTFDSDTQGMYKCFEETSGRMFESTMKFIKEEAYVVRLKATVTEMKRQAKSRIKEGTICKYLFNSFCVLCNILH